MNEGQLPTFEKGKVYLLNGETLNSIVEKIIKEIIVDKKELTVTKDAPNKVSLAISDDSKIEDVVLVFGATGYYCTLTGTIGDPIEEP